ncbi:hypothetical protein M231_06435 [Tremella mesenterica]|uniref:Uncharacterized protein n=1 Tax=Tremella mesenterica TaxID=5217 RepID=A0A4Q1BBY2_TREME|nr:hypothetical protein M231_06435 [Tremella mesenterica]
MPTAWTAEERGLLFAYVEKYGAGSWTQAGLHVPSKTSKQCRDQWV